METLNIYVKDDDPFFENNQPHDIASNPDVETPIIQDRRTEFEEVNELMSLDSSCKGEDFNFLAEYCRICACAYNNMIPIYNETGIELQLEEKINSYLPITVTRSDKLPLQVCELCTEKLNITHDLIISCVNSDTKFKYFEATSNEEEDASKVKRKVVVMKLVSADGAQLSVSTRVAKALQYLKAKKSGEAPAESAAPTPLDACARHVVQQRAQDPAASASEDDLDKVKVAAVAEFCVVASGRERSLAPRAAGRALNSKICEVLGPVDRGTNKRLVEAMHEIVCSSQSQQQIAATGCTANAQRCNCGRSAIFKTSFQRAVPRRSLSRSSSNPACQSRVACALVANARRFRCHACPKSFRDAYRLTLHKQTAHGPRRPSAPHAAFACAACGRHFARRTSLLIHQVLERGTRRFACSSCERRFAHRCSLELHLAAEHPDTKPWLCARCGRSFVTKSSLREHHCAYALPLRAVPSPTQHMTIGEGMPRLLAKERAGGGGGGLRFLCAQCPRRFASRQTLAQHEATHAGARPYQCGICYVGFIRKTSLTKHYKTHASEKVICCKVCKASFPTVTGLINHSKTHSSDDWRPLAKREPNSDGASVSGGVGSSAGGGPSGPDAYQCSVCSKFLSNKLSLSLHMRTHTGDKPYECSVCQKRFTQKPALTYHQRLHTGERPHVCQFCGKGFNSKVGKESHERIHTGERPYKCGQCGVGFRCSANLRQHTWIHSDRRPFMCDVCKKLFRRREALQVHMRIHTGERPYSCPVCGRRFTQKGDMVKHTRSHSKDSQGVTCHKCGKVFSRRVHYKMHEEQCRHANIQLIQKPDKHEEKGNLNLLHSEVSKEENEEPKTIAIVNEDMLPKFTDITIVPRDVVQEIEVEYEAK